MFPLFFALLFGQFSAGAATCSSLVEAAPRAIEFNWVNPGQFVTCNAPDGPNEDAEPSFPLKVDEPFEMMSTPITIAHWQRLNREPLAKSGWDLPKRRVSYESVLAFIEQVNRLSDQNDPLIYEVIADHRPGAHYRLPTEEEWTMVATLSIAENKRLRLPWRWHRVGWFYGNSGGVPQPVGLKAPLYLDGKPFYDLFGNVEEYVRGFFREDLRVPLADVPLEERMHVTVRGGSVRMVHRSDKSILVTRRALRSRYQGGSHWWERYAGFRLVREVTTQKTFIRKPDF